MQLTGYIDVCMYPYNITDILPLHVAHLPLLSSLFILGLCIPKGSLQYFPTIVHKNLAKYHQPASFSFKATKELCIETTALLSQVHKHYICTLNVLTLI